MAVVLYGTEMQAGSNLGPLSVLMKGEMLPAGTRWQGTPCEPLSSNQARVSDAVKTISTAPILNAQRKASKRREQASGAVLQPVA
jgi:hypothetical protein